MFSPTQITLDGRGTSGAKLAAPAGTGAAPARVPAAGSAPLASSVPTSSAASGTSTSPSSRAAVVPSGVRIVASRMGRL